MEAGGSQRRAAKGLRALVLTLGGVATGAGLHSALTGASSVPGAKRTGTAIDSELRYYGVFYSAFGAAALRLAPRAEHEPRGVRDLAVVLFAAGTSRAYGWRKRGRPHPGQVALLGLELTVPPAMLALQAIAARAPQATGPSTRSV